VTGVQTCALPIFAAYEDRIGEYIESGKLGFITEIFTAYKKRHDESMGIINELLKRDYDFNRDEYIAVDREKTEYAIDGADMRERWRKNIKLQLLKRT